MKIYKVGLIGCGWICEVKHAGAISGLENAEIAALCDINREKAEKIKQQFHLNADVYTDYKEMLKDEKLDIIHVLTPNPLHCEMTVRALEAGKHVLCEKPMATTKAECDLMIATAERMHKKLTVGFAWRYRASAQYMKQLVDSGELGEIYYAKAHAIRYRMIPTWGDLLNGHNGGGALIDSAPHALDLVLWLMNNYEPLSVKANIYNKMIPTCGEGNPWGRWKEEDFKVEDSGFAFITMKNGATIVLEAAWAINMLSGDNLATLCGTKAGADMFGTDEGVRVNGVQFGKTYIKEPKLNDVPVPYGAITDHPGVREAKEWIRCITDDTEPYIKPQQAAVVTQIIEGIYQSSKTGKEVIF